MNKPYVDDSEMTEIIIQPDGRIYAFGLSVEVAEVLRELDAGGQISVGDAVTDDHGVTVTSGYNERGGTHGEG